MGSELSLNETPIVSEATDHRRATSRQTPISRPSSGDSEPQESEDGAIGSLTGADEGLTPLEAPPEPTAAERQVADLIPIETDPDDGRSRP